MHPELIHTLSAAGTRACGCSMRPSRSTVGLMSDMRRTNSGTMPMCAVLCCVLCYRDGMPHQRRHCCTPASAAGHMTPCPRIPGCHTLGPLLLGRCCTEGPGSRTAAASCQLALARWHGTCLPESRAAGMRPPRQSTFKPHHS